ncbi:MAG: hypothetical protein ACKV2T_07475 [Kofleriaceae bacterium]
MRCHVAVPGLATLVVTLSVVELAQAQPQAATDTFAVREGGALLVDGGLVLGFPTALPTGLSRGIGGGVTFGECPLRWGARAAWVTATEYGPAWEVTHSDLRLRVTGSAQHDAGRGTIAIRAGLGGTLVHETRLRNQGMRAGLIGDELETSAFAMLPAADLEAVVAVKVIGPWALIMSGGPSVALFEGTLRTSWTAQLGIAWQP